MAESRRRETGSDWISADTPQDDPAPEAPTESVSEQELEAEADTFMAFDPRYRQPFEGLLYVGKLKTRVDMLGHWFTVKTMTTAEKLKVLEVAKRWEDTALGYQMAYKAAIVAGAIETVDGRPILAPVNTVDPIEQRFDYLVRTWHPLVIDYLYRHIDVLEGQVLKIMENLGVNPEPRLVTQRAADDVEIAESGDAGAEVG